jgi:hypothetical protein
MHLSVVPHGVIGINLSWKEKAQAENAPNNKIDVFWETRLRWQGVTVSSQKPYWFPGNIGVL